MVAKKLILLTLILLLFPIVYSLNMDLQYDEKPVYNLDGRINWIVLMPYGYRDTNFTCVSYISKNNETIQINPKYTEKSVNFINKIYPILDESEYFTTNNGIVNIYFTNEKVKIDGVQNYTYGVKCSNKLITLTEERILIPTYEDLNVVNTRWLWAKDNMYYIIGLIILLIITLIIITSLWRASK